MKQFSHVSSKKAKHEHSGVHLVPSQDQITIQHFVCDSGSGSSTKKCTTPPSQDRLATKWLNEIPGRALDIIRNNRLPPGAALVSVESEVTTPSSKEFTGNGSFYKSNPTYKNIYWSELGLPKIVMFGFKK